VAFHVLQTSVTLVLPCVCIRLFDDIIIRRKIEDLARVFNLSLSLVVLRECNIFVHRDPSAIVNKAQKKESQNAS
jgi:hypothetical protein